MTASFMPVSPTPQRSGFSLSTLTYAWATGSSLSAILLLNERIHSQSMDLKAKELTIGDILVKVSKTNYQTMNPDRFSSSEELKKQLQKRAKTEATAISRLKGLKWGAMGIFGATQAVAAFKVFYKPC